MSGLRRSRGFQYGVAILALCAALTPAMAGPRQKKPVKLTSTQRVEYRIVRDTTEMGKESVEKKIFDNNTVVFTIDATMGYGEGVTMKQRAELTVEEESYFPRALHIVKNIDNRDDSQDFEHRVDVEMFSNVAVLSSELRGQGGSRRVVVPTGVAIVDLGVLSYLYQTLFWYDRETAGNQSFQWLDPISGSVNSGELKLEGEVSITVMGKKTRASVFKMEREKFGPATVWVDKQGTIVRGEQNLFTYELVKKTSS
jgi:hypothetical protein